MRRATALAGAAVAALLPAPALADDILFQEGFEPGFTAESWSVISWGGSWELSSQQARSGSGALSLRTSALVLDTGQSMRNTLLETWFYDDMAGYRESHVVVSQTGDAWTDDWLMVGTECIRDSGFYYVFLGCHSCAAGVRGPARSLGWHKVTIKNVDGQNLCFVDGTLVTNTGFQGDWRYLILFENLHCESSNSWFDDVLVYRVGNSLPADPARSTATDGAATTLLACPAHDGPSLASVGATIQVQVRNVAGNLVSGFPAADIWLGAAVQGTPSFCSPGLTADHDTDANGQTTISGMPLAGGCSQSGLRVMLAGQPITGSPALPISVNSPDLTGDLHVNLGDIGPFSAALNGGAFNFCADFYRDGRIDLVDVSVMSMHLGHVCP